jgi:diaminopimelate decarboxylase
VLSVHGGYREIRSLKKTTDETFVTDLCGNTTYSRDYLGRNCSLPKLQVGDVVAILDVGAYGYAMATHFLHRPRPAEILLEDDKHRLIRRRESYQVLIEHQIV